MNKLKILIAEDDDGHALLIEETLQEAGIFNEIFRFRDGKELWDFFTEKKSELAFDSDNHYLVLLDINMPQMSGLEVLQKMKETEILKKIPVMMLTTTDDPREIEKCYHLGCSVYITKPIDFNEFIKTVNRLGLFIQVVKV
ncbi:MAG: response regulator [Candidatus Marinimicrobia bacterium]|nr:response regulator [Candidatus Neomarinimicrobiota bacterium]